MFPEILTPDYINTGEKFKCVDVIKYQVDSEEDDDIQKAIECIKNEWLAHYGDWDENYIFIPEDQSIYVLIEK